MSVTAIPYRREGTELGDGARVEVATGPATTGAYLCISSPLSMVQVGVVLTREQLVAHRDAINAVLGEAA